MNCSCQAVVDCTTGVIGMSHRSHAKKMRTTRTHKGSCTSYITFTFAGSGDTPSDMKTNPKQIERTLTELTYVPIQC